MNAGEYKNQVLPPRLTMDEYADFISKNLESADRKQIRLQKEIEERITKRFCIPDES